MDQFHMIYVPIITQTEDYIYNSQALFRKQQNRRNYLSQEPSELFTHLLHSYYLATKFSANYREMGSQNHFRVLIICLIALIGSTHAQLQQGFYAGSCPNAEKIVWNYVFEHVPGTPSIAAALLRLHFHDCFVGGCDGSVLLNSTKDHKTEKDAVPNLTLRGFDFIDEVKSLVEAECPGVVSCADIVALTARDSVHSIGGPFWNVPTGRRDSLTSNAQDVLQTLPAPFHNVTVLTSRFNNVGLDLNDLVVLSGAHTIGIAHCSTIASRLYNFTGKGDTDPSLDKAYAENLKTRKCKSISDKTTLIEMDPGSRNTFDLGYYHQVVKHRGLFISDAALLTSSATRAILNQQLQSTETFFQAFAKSMEKMGTIDVTFAPRGEIRKHCALAN